MVASTIGAGLSAAAMYPEPFVKNGVADVAIVYGSHTSATSDLVSVTAISSDLGALVLHDSVAQTPENVSGGDFVKLEKSSTKFHLGNGILDVMSSSITNDDLPVLLADGTYSDSNNDDFDYTQKLTLGNLTLTMFDDDDYKQDSPSVGIRIPSGSFVMNYTLDFNTAPDWADIDQTDIEIMGKQYFVLSSTTNTTLNLLDSANTAVLNEGETTTLNIDGVSYEVSAQIYSATRVYLTINGERTNSLDEGQTQKLRGTNTYIGIKTINYNSKEAGVSSVEFAIGSGKLELTNGQDIQMNDDSINGLSAHFTNSNEQLQKIIITWDADDTMFVADGSTAVMPGFKNLKLSYSGMTFPEEEKFSVKGGSSTYIQFKDFPLKDSTEDIPLLYGASNAFTGIGKDSSNVLFTTNESSFTYNGTNSNNFFIASYDGGSSAESYMLRATSFSSENSGATNKTTIQYRKDGSWVNKKEDAESGDTVTLGDVSLTIGTINKDLKTVAITGGSNTNFNRLYSKEGLKVWLPWRAGANNAQIAAYGPGALNLTSNLAGHNSTNFHLAFYEEDKNDNIGSGNNFNVSLGWNSDSEPQVSDLVGESVSAVEEDSSNVFRTFMYSALATEFMWDQGSGNTGQDSIEITYHGAESSANLYLTDVSTNVGGGSSSGSIGVPLKDTEVAQASSKNLIVVGGSCVNTVAAELLKGAGSERFCGAEWTAETGLGEGKFLIETFSRSGGKVATLVAGWAPQDTLNAANALTTQTVDITANKKYTGSTADSIESMTA